jgi:hypothetical protein
MDMGAWAWHVRMHTCTCHTHCMHMHMQANEMAAAIASRAPMVVGLLEKQPTHAHTMPIPGVHRAYTVRTPCMPCMYHV